MDKDEFWAKLDELDDEEQVRQKVDLGDYGEKKQGWAIAWLKKQDRQKLRNKSTPWHKTWRGQAIIAVLIIVLATVLISRLAL